MLPSQCCFISTNCTARPANRVIKREREGWNRRGSVNHCTEVCSLGPGCTMGPGVAPFPALFSRSGLSCQSCLSVRKPTQSFHGFPLFSSLSISVHRCHPLRCVSVFHSSDFSHSGCRDNERNIRLAGAGLCICVYSEEESFLSGCVWLWDGDLVICSDSESW